MKVKKTFRKKQRGGARETSVRTGSDNGFNWAAGDHDGYKSPSEDRNTILPVGEMSLLVCVFDGHSGSTTANYVNSNLPQKIKERVESENAYRDTEAIKKIFEEEFVAINEILPNANSGSTGSVALITPENIIVANAGDSPVLYFTESGELLFNSVDHDCYNDSELARIKEVGGFCGMRTDGVMGLATTNPILGYDKFGRYVYERTPSLMVTRGFGDAAYKPSITAKPSTYVVKRQPGTYLVVCSDSFTERHFPQEGRIKNAAKPEEVMTEMLTTLKGEDLAAGVRATVEAQVKRPGFYQKFAPPAQQFAGDNTTLCVVKFAAETPVVAKTVVNNNSVNLPKKNVANNAAAVVPKTNLRNNTTVGGRRKVRKGKTRKNK
jgi:serine/threonine protein phosphatase PrpC